MAEVKKRLTKQEKLAESKKKALALQRRLSAADERLEDFNLRMDKEIRTQKYMGDKKSRMNYISEYSRLNNSAEKAYNDYRRHLRKEFGSSIERSPVSFASRKYKKGFMDKQYVNDMYDFKLKKIGGKTA